MSVLNGKFSDNSPSGVQLLNPFVHKLTLEEPIDKIKLAVFTVFLLPFRVISICVLLVISWLLACIGLYGVSLNDLQTKPLRGWRKALKRLICLVGRSSYLAGGIAISIKGRQVSRSEAPILVIAPHSTFLDSVIVYVTNMSSVIVRKESNDNYAGKLINYTQPIYVWRDDPNSRQNTIKDIIDRANSKDGWPQILIFPEGTCTNRTSLIQFKPGAFYPGVPVQPVCIRYPNKLDTFTWTWEGPGVFKLLWLTLTQVHSIIEIEFLPVYNPSEEEKQNPKLYAENVRKVMAKSLNVPTSSYTYDHCRVMTRAKDMNIPYAVDIVEIEQMRAKLGLDKTNIEKKIVESYQVDDTNCNLTLPEFKKTLQITKDNIDSTVSRLFDLFDKECVGTIDYREYLLCALFLIQANEPIIAIAEYVSKMYEKGSVKSGKLSRESLFLALRHTIAATEEVSDLIYKSIDTEHRGFVTFDEVTLHLKYKPEYKHLFKTRILASPEKKKIQ